MQIPILSGIYADEAPNYRIAYPKNLMPVAVNTGISDGYLRPAEGITAYGTGPGIDRGAIVWKGEHYRIMGSKLVSIPASGGAAVELGDVGGTSSQCALDYSFDYLAIVSDGALWLYDGTSLVQNTDADLGTALDVIFIDGYFMTTDGEFLVVTDLGNPFSVNPLKYGSSEVDPDPVVGLIKINNEPWAVNRHTIEVFQNVGGTLFPFNRIDGSRIDRGAIGRDAFCFFMESLAFLGSARNEAPGIYVGISGQSQKISTNEIDQILDEYAESQLEKTILESRVFDKHQLLYVHLPDQTLIFDGETSTAVGKPVWFRLSSSIVGNAQYRGRNFIYHDKRWLCGDTQSNQFGYLDNTLSTHYGQITGWEFNTSIFYNEARGGIVNELELVGLPGRVPLGIDPVIWTSYSPDGETWSQEKAIQAGKTGDRLKRLIWRKQGFMRQTRIQKFRGTSDAHLAISRLEAQLEQLAY
jgi:hypothetical protein